MWMIRLRAQPLYFVYIDGNIVHWVFFFFYIWIKWMRQKLIVWRQDSHIFATVLNSQGCNNSCKRWSGSWFLQVPYKQSKYVHMNRSYIYLTVSTAIISLGICKHGLLRYITSVGSIGESVQKLAHWQKNIIESGETPTLV